MERWLGALVAVVCVCTLSGAESRRFRLTFGADPSTTAIVGWDASSGNGHVLYYDTVDHGTAYSSYRFSQVPSATDAYLGMASQFATLDSLVPGRTYYFVVRDSEGLSARMYFRTVPNTPDTRLSAIFGGDSRTNRAPRQAGNRLVAKLRPHFVAFSGDFVESVTDVEWQAWLDDWQLSISSDGRIYPIMPAQGNHESTESIERLFKAPSGVHYSLAFGGSLVRFYTLNTETGTHAAQADWLRNDLQSHPSPRWRMAQYHFPIRPHQSSKGEGAEEYTYWAPLFGQYRFALINEADAHTAKTTWPIVPSLATGSDEGFERDDANGTVFIGEGCWGAPLRACDDPKSWTRQCAGDTPFDHFSWVWIGMDTVEVRTVRFSSDSSVSALGEGNVFAVPATMNLWTDNLASGVIHITQRGPTAVVGGDVQSIAMRMLVSVDHGTLTLSTGLVPPLKATVVDMRGRSCTEVVSDRREVTIPVRSLRRGTYVACVSNGSRSENCRFSITR